MVQYLVPVSEPRPRLSVPGFNLSIHGSCSAPCYKTSLCSVANLGTQCPHNEGKKQAAARTSLTSDDTGRFGTLCGDMFDPIPQ
jgi:hypothetical protein